MVRLIMGVKGSGKTKQLIELINAAAKDEAGNVVCIEPKRDMSYNIHYNIRLIDAQEYDLHSYEMFRGFISGLYAGNYDISQVFIDNLCKTVGSDVDGETEKFLNWLDAFGEKNGIKFTVTISGDVAIATDGMRKFLSISIHPILKAQASFKRGLRFCFPLSIDGKNSIVFSQIFENSVEMCRKLCYSCLVTKGGMQNGTVSHDRFQCEKGLHLRYGRCDLPRQPNSSRCTGIYPVAS